MLDRLNVIAATTTAVTAGVRIQCFESLRYQSQAIDDIALTPAVIVGNEEMKQSAGDHFTPPLFVMTPFPVVIASPA